MNKGICLIACGPHPLYTHYAYNLAMSIRAHSDLPIVLYHQGPGLSQLFEDQKEVFSDIQELPYEFYMNNGEPHWVKPKLHLYDLSPFDETIFLDADMIFSPFKNIENLFLENSDREIQFACRGEKRMDEGLRSEWVNLNEVQEVHGFEHWYEVSSEVIYFKKGDIAKDVFDYALDYYSNPKMGIKKWVRSQSLSWEVENKPNCIMEFAGGIPDEVPFSLALEATGTKIKAPYTPSYWQPQYFNKITPDVQVQKNYYLISIGGAALQPNTQRIYNNLVKHYSQKTLMKRAPYQAVAKQRLLKERNKI